MESIEAEVTFLREEEGGRRGAPFDSTKYRPHIVVGDPNQRRAIVDGHRMIREEYLGVMFSGDGEELEQGKVHRVNLQFLWSPRVDYGALRPRSTFTIREGVQIVGFGTVLRRKQSSDEPIAN